MSIYPNQKRTIDPFRDYNSNATNELTRIITRGKNCLSNNHAIEATLINDTTAEIQSGFVFKDDVLIEFTDALSVDFNSGAYYPNLSDSATNALSTFGDGYYYVILDYTYVKTKPAPQASIQILEPNQRINFDSTTFVLLQVIDVTAEILVEVLSYDPENPDNKRLYPDVYIGFEPSLPTFEQERDEGRLIYEQKEQQVYFGTAGSWQDINSGHIRIDTTLASVGQLIYINDDTAQTEPALAAAPNTLAQGGVLVSGPVTDGVDSGKILLFGKLPATQIESSITINYGDILYLSPNEAGTVTNVAPPSYPQFVGTSVSPNGQTSTCDIWLVPSARGGAGGGAGDVTAEDLLYHSLLLSSTYSECHYDTFRVGETVVVGGSPLPLYDFGDTNYYSGSSGSYITTPELIDATGNVYNFLFHVDKSPSLNLTLEYNIGSGWVVFNADENINILTGFTSLQVRMTWDSSGYIYSYGCLYKETEIQYTTHRRLFEKYIVTSDSTAPLDMLIPNNAHYTKDGESLEIYLNGVRSIINEHYEELDDRTVRFLIELKTDDIIVFVEDYGFVDVSEENTYKIDDIISGTQIVGDSDKVDGRHANEFVDNTSTQIITGDKNFTGNLQKDGSDVIPYSDIYNKTYDIENLVYIDNYKNYFVGRDPLSATFSSDGTKMYIADDSTDKIYQYNLSTAWDVSTTVDAEKNKDVSSEITTTESVEFNSDGTKMYVLDYSSSTVYQYNLSTAWDVSTAVYTPAENYTITQTTQFQDITFSSNGTKFYAISTLTNTVYAYDMTSAWDITSATYNTENYASAATGLQSVTFKVDGTKMFILAETNNKIYEYDLSTPWDINTVIYSGVYFELMAHTPTDEDVTFSPDGTKMYILNRSSKAVTQYQLNTAWDIRGVSFNDSSLLLGRYDTHPTDVAFNSDGTMLYVLGNANNIVWQFSLSTPWDVSTASYTDKSLDMSSEDTGPESIFFNSDGSKIFIIGNVTNYVYQYNLSTAWDISTATYTPGERFSIAQDGTPQCLRFNLDGHFMYILGDVNDRIYMYRLTTAWDITTVTYTGRSFYFGPGSTLEGMAFNSNGTNYYIANDSNDLVHEYKLSSAWDITTLVDTGRSHSITTEDGNVESIIFSPDGTKLYMVGSDSDSVHQYLTNTLYFRK